jgi:hypothetical protein
MSDGPQKGHENTNIYPMLKLLFGEYVSNLGLTTKEVENVLLEDFVEYLVQNSDTLNWQDICIKLKLPPELYHGLIEQLRLQGTLPGMASQWMGFIMGCRPVPKHDVGAIQIIVNIRYRDGRQTPLTCYIPEELSEQLTDSAVCLAIQQQCHAVYMTVKEEGVDGLYEKSVLPGDEVTPENENAMSQLPGSPIFPDDVHEHIVNVRAMKQISSKCPPSRGEVKPGADATGEEGFKAFSGFKPKPEVDTEAESGENQKD